jgi:hypothetical protein
MCDTGESAAGIRATTNDNVAAYLVALGRYDEARRYARDALDISARFRFAAQQAWALQHLAAVAALRTHVEGERSEHLSRAAVLMGFVGARYSAIGGALEPTDQWEYDRITAALRTALQAEDLDALTARGALLREDEAIAEALRA